MCGWMCLCFVRIKRPYGNCVSYKFLNIHTYKDVCANTHILSNKQGTSFKDFSVYFIDKL